MILGVLIIFRILSNQPHLVIVNTAEVFSDRFEKNVFAAGTLEVKDKQEFFAENKTTVKEILAETGQKVAKGQVILKTDESSLRLECSQKRLSCDELRAKLVQCESNLRLLEQDYNSAQQEYENIKILYENGAASKKELEDVTRKLNEAEEKLVVERDATLPLLKSQLAQAEMAYTEAEEKLRRASIISPMDGVLLKLAVREGQEVEPGTLLAQIGNPEHLQIETGINEIDAAQLKIGDGVEIINKALLNEPLKGKIEYISPIAELVNTSQGEQTQVKIRIAVEEAKNLGQIKPGFNVNLKVILAQKDQALLIPYEALVQENNRDVVYVVGQDAVVSKKEIEIGLSNELYFEVLSGLKVGDKVVLNPDEQIQDGVKVIVNAAGQ